MRPFTLLEPRSLEEACLMLSDVDGAKPIAGGTALVILMKQGLFLPGVLVNLQKTRDARGIAESHDGGLRIGALTTIQEVAANPVVRARYPVLADSCHAVANIRIRNVATLGGNMAHADYQSDPPTALLALDAVVELMSARGTRNVPLDDFLRGPYMTALEGDEVVSALRLPPQLVGSRSSYLKFVTGSSEDRPCVGVAAILRVADGVCIELHLAIGAATRRSMRFQEAELAAQGKRLRRGDIDSIAEFVASAIDPIEDLNGDARYKRRVVRAVVRRSLAQLAEEAA
jgi:carbon-monoxide dehydrogenase medium subunit